MSRKTVSSLRDLLDGEIEELEDVLGDLQFRRSQLEFLSTRETDDKTLKHFVVKAHELLNTACNAVEEAIVFLKP